MKQHLAHVAIIVDDYDKAIEYYTHQLKFDLIEDTVLSADKRWVLVRPPGGYGCSLLLAKASNTYQETFIGNQSGGRVFLFLYTDQFDKDYQNLLNRNIKIVREPEQQSYGKVVVFEDLYGNLWDLIEPVKPEENFYSTALLSIKESVPIDEVITALKLLREKTLLEKGNVLFELKQLKEDPSKIIIWECFVNEAAFNDHLKSEYLQHFLQMNWVDFEFGYLTNNII